MRLPIYAAVFLIAIEDSKTLEFIVDVKSIMNASYAPTAVRDNGGLVNTPPVLPPRGSTASSAPSQDGITTDQVRASAEKDTTKRSALAKRVISGSWTGIKIIWRYVKKLSVVGNRVKKVWKSTATFWNSWWWAEILSCGLAILSFVAIIVVLRVNNGRQLPEWRFGITINTLVSLILVLLKAGLSLPLTEGLSQLKWRAFRSKRRLLEDFESFDSASRGPWGSFNFLFLVNRSGLQYRNTDLWTKFSHAVLKNLTYYLAKVLALLIILLYFGDPFLQQAIQGVACSHTTSEVEARVARTNNFTILGVDPDLSTSNNFFASPGIETALELALYAPSQQPSSLVNTDCSSGNCTFPVFSTVGMCHSCEDISSFVRNASGDSYIANFTLEVGSTIIWIGGRTYFQSTAITNAGSNPSLGPWVNVSILIGPDESGTWYTNQSHTPTAVTCTLFPCVRGFNSSITNGVLSETAISSTQIWASQPDHVEGINITVPQGPWSYQLASTNTLNNGSSQVCNSRNESETGFVLVFEANIDAAPPFPMVTGISGNQTVEAWLPTNFTEVWFPEECVWSFEVEAFEAIAEWVLQELGDLFVAIELGTTSVSGPLPATRLWRNGAGNLESTDAFISNASDFLTAAIRQNGASGEVGYALGSIQTSSICLYVEWSWLTFHAVVIGLTLLFLMVIVLQPDRYDTERLWKSSILAVLFCSMDEGTAEKARLEPTKEGISKAAKESTVQLVDALDGTSRFG